MEFIYRSPAGPLKLVFSGQVLTALRAASGEERKLPGAEGAGHASDIVAWLSAYFRGENPSLENIFYKARGTPFQERVWELLSAIPYGTRVTYGFLASLLAGRAEKTGMLARAVGGALAKNPIWIIIPCHRVIRSSGEIGAYAGGQAMKKALLELEAAPCAAGRYERF